MQLVLDTGIVLAASLGEAGFRPLAAHALHCLDFTLWEAESVLHEYVWRLARGWSNPQWPTLKISDFELAFANLKRAVVGDKAGRPLVESTVFGGRLADDAWLVAERCGFAKVYDAASVALARTLTCPLVTLDARLMRSPAARLATIKAPTQL